MAQRGSILTTVRVAVLGKAQSGEEMYGEFESECPSCGGAQGTSYVGTFKDVGRIHRRTLSNTYTEVGPANFLDGTALLAIAHFLNNRVLPSA